MAISRAGAIPVFALLFAVSVSAADPDASLPSLADRIEAGWQVQRRWVAVTANGSFIYEFDLKTWNGAGKLKESFTRSARVFNRGEIHHTEILSATRDGRDETAEARAEEEKRSPDDRSKRKDDFPSPFDPRFRDRYAFAQEAAPDGGEALAFHPREPFDGAVQGRARYDASGALRRVDFTLAKRPRFTKRLDFTIIIGADGYPERVDSSGDISLLVWKRRFESVLIVRDVHPGEKETR